MKKSIWLVFILLLLSGCTVPQTNELTGTPEPPAKTITAQNTSTNTPPPASTLTPSPTPTITITPTKTLYPKVTYDVSHFQFGKLFTADCIDQFPVTPDEQGLAAINVVFDNWIYSDPEHPFMLGGGYEMFAGAEAWYRQNGYKIPVVIPLAVVNREAQKLIAVTNGGGSNEFHDFMYERSNFTPYLESFTELRQGMTLKVFIAMPTDNLTGYSSRGFGFEATNYYQSDIDTFLATGDASGFGNILWPVIHIVNTQEWPPTPVPPTPTQVTVSRTEDGPAFSVEGVSREFDIPSGCTDQFPITPDENGVGRFCTSFDNWILGSKENPIMLSDNYEMLVGAECWYQQDEEEIPVLLPLAVRKLDTNEMATFSSLPREFDEVFYEATEAYWQAATQRVPGSGIRVIFVGMPTGDVESYIFNGWGFETMPYTQKDIDAFLSTGDISGFNNILWPVIDIR